MFEKNNTYKVLKIFLENPTKEFGLRQIAREINLSPTAVKRHLKELEKKKLIQTFYYEKIPKYQAIIDKKEFKLFQKISIQYELFKSGLIDYLWDTLSPEAIILFGSYAKGEATEQSDIDVFIIGKKKKINISKYQEKFSQEIQLFQDELKNIPKELKNNLINGIILKGYLKIL